MSITHYTVLGVQPTASPDVIRRAYREAVRRTHPDVARSTSTTASDMARITEAWAVLSDPARRAAYDASLRAAPRAAATNEPVVFLRHPPARFPWRLVAAIIAGGIIVILVLNALAQPTVEAGPDGLLGPGSCIIVDETQAAIEVDCDGEHEGVVRQLIGFDMTCPSDTEAIRDRQGMGTACVVAP